MFTSSLSQKTQDNNIHVPCGYFWRKIQMRSSVFRVIWLYMGGKEENSNWLRSVTNKVTKTTVKAYKPT